MANGDQEPSTGWMSDVQRAMGLILIGTFAAITFFATIRLLVLSDAASITDMSKTLQAALVNMGLIALGFFFGSNMSKMLADAGQQKIVEKLTSTNPPPPAGGPVAPLAGPVVVPSWWSLLTVAEQAAIEAAAVTDADVQAHLTALKSGKAEAPNLAGLVAKGLLTQARADEINPK